MMANIPFKTQVYMLNGHPTDTINARDLHTYLATECSFTDWFIHIIDKFHLKEDQDYIVLLYKTEAFKAESYELENVQRTERKPITHEDHYYLSFDAVKIVSALDHSSEGRELRYKLHDWQHSKNSENQRVTLPIMDMMNLLRLIRLYQGLAIELPHNSIQISEILERIQFESK